MVGSIAALADPKPTRAPMPDSAGRQVEIDGLRGLAILPVVFYHAGWTLLPGGFVGVDIFFVISGYLIGGILDREITSGKFSLLSFYERRAGRIGPALVLVLAASSIAAIALLLPLDLTR